MKVTTYDEMESGLVGVGQTSLQSGSLRKEATINNDTTRRGFKKMVNEARTEKNARKGKTPRVTNRSLQKKEEKLEGRKERRSFLNKNEGRSL